MFLIVNLFIYIQLFFLQKYENNGINANTMEKSQILLIESDENTWQNRLATHPYIWDDAKEWRKKFAESMVKKELEKMELKSKKVAMGEQFSSFTNFVYCYNPSHILLS